ncbi:NAD-dependent epimerase/dehydratase family protein [Sphingomonas sp. GB1N7]|uniref:NAD-dependent epimerase/dehydratase family protein n=1 Tax=Parasphingomonas caseinilytica TaxID=3096158 RepID=UPI002FC588B2
MILVFGGNGFVGQHVARRLVDEGEDVVVTTHSRSAIPLLLAQAIAEGRVSIASVDITDPFDVMAVVARHRPAVVIDLSGHHPKALTPARDVAFRTSALVNILESARLNSVGRVVLMSSMDVYWGLPTGEAPFQETDPVPLLELDDHFIVQSWAKKTLEVIGNLYRRQHGMDVVFVRASGIYGPGYRTWLNLPSRLLRAAISANSGQELADGGETAFADGGYDQIYVKDAARAITKVALAPALSHPAYNVGSGRLPLYDEFATAVRDVVPGCDIRLAVRPASQPRGAMDGRWMRIDRIRDELGFEPKYNVREAMADYATWLLSNTNMHSA